CTTPVTFSAGAALCSIAVASGNCSGWSTLKLLESRSGTTVAAGGASAFGSGFPSLQPARKTVTARHSATPDQRPTLGREAKPAPSREATPFISPGRKSGLESDV